MIRRPRRSTPATIVAVLLLAVCVLVAVAVVQSLLGGVPFLSFDQLLAVTSTQHWNSAATVAFAIVVALLGLILLVAALRPGNPTVLPLGRREGPDGRPGADAGVRRHTYAKDLEAAVAGVSGITHTQVSVSANTVTARVRVAAADPTPIPELVRRRIDERVAVIGPAFRPKVKVRARPERT